jgi:hypothetical protein
MLQSFAPSSKRAGTAIHCSPFDIKAARQGKNANSGKQAVDI